VLDTPASLYEVRAAQAAARVRTSGTPRMCRWRPRAPRRARRLQELSRFQKSAAGGALGRWRSLPRR
jgi:hypothetical protein